MKEERRDGLLIRFIKDKTIRKKVLTGRQKGIFTVRQGEVPVVPLPLPNMFVFFFISIQC